METTRLYWDVLENSSDFRSFVRIDQSIGLELLEMFKSGKPLRDSWTPIELKLLQGKGEAQKPIADFMSGFIVPAVSPRAISIIQPIIERQVELLPLKTKAGPFLGLNVREVDCLDMAGSIVKRFKSSGRILRVEKYAFVWEKLAGINIFRVPELGLSRMFVSDLFKKTVEENQLTGLFFYPVPLS